MLCLRKFEKLVKGKFYNNSYKLVKKYEILTTGGKDDIHLAPFWSMFGLKWGYIGSFDRKTRDKNAP